jgi:ABC-type multidrug transport system fused ATPase/permease subunit
MGNGFPRLIRSVSAEFRRQLLTTYFLSAVENLCYVSFPSLIGLAVDGISKGRGSMLIPFAAVWIVRLVFGNTRLIYDTSTFVRIYGRLVTDLVTRHRRSAAHESRIIARASLSRELVTFFEISVPALAAALIKLVGSIAMLAFYDWKVAGVAIGFLLPISIGSRSFVQRARRVNAAINNRLEKEPRIVTTAAISGVTRHYYRLRKLHLRVARAQATIWSVSEVAVLLLAMWTMWRFSSSANASTGSTYAVLAYVWTFHQCVDDLPNILQTFARIQDISERVLE